ncbi:hypothetical protein ACHAW6_012886 [Cyclotella cf. meneghiniana]
MSGDDTAPTIASAIDDNKYDSAKKDNRKNGSLDNNQTISIDRHNDQFRVQVKPEFLVQERPAVLAQPNNNSETKSENKKDENRSNKHPKNRGQNKKRPRDAKISCNQKACLQVIRGETCPFDNCKYNHDLKEMLANRIDDLSEGEKGVEWLRGECPNWKLKGYCPFGLMCRLGSCHINMSTGQNLRRTVEDHEQQTTSEDAIGTSTDRSNGTPKPGTLLNHQNDVKNVISKETIIKLRKNQYPFVCKRHYELSKQNDEKNPKPNNASLPTVESTNTPALELKERKLIDFRNKVYVAPLTTVGNLPFRRIMKQFGADITCGEMALAQELLQGKPSEWALLKRHPCEDVFGVQIAAGHADQYTRVAEILANEPEIEVDFVDFNLGCPIDLVCDKGAGACLMLREKKLRGSLEGVTKVLNCPVTVKMRTGWDEKKNIAHLLVPSIQKWGIDGISAVMIHGRSRLQRYSKLANWDYIAEIAKSQSTDLRQIPVIGNGDVFSYTDYETNVLSRVADRDGEDGCSNNLLPTAMLARGALIKPWLPTEIKERRHWDISASERLDILKDFVRFGLEHWGSDQQGVNHTRRFLLEWISFLHRYVPVGMLEVIPQKMNQRPPNNMCGRNDLETLMLSTNCADWIKISEMLIGPVPDDFAFEPKHKANSYS